MPCIHQTDYDWIEYIKNNNLKNPVFWKGANAGRNFYLKPDDYFYFVIKGTKLVAGRGKYVSSSVKSLTAAWKDYGSEKRLCSDTEEEFIKHVNSVLRKRTDKNNILCIELDSVEWIPENSMFYFDEDTFSSSVQQFRYKKFNDEQKHVLNLPLIDLTNYYSQDEEFCDILTLNTQIEDAQGREEFIEGARRIITHKSIERNRALITLVKNERKWTCDICSMTFLDKYNVEYIEAHHKIPLNKAGEKINGRDQIALLCANCHRAVHKKMVINETMSYEAIRVEIRNTLGIID
jgi:predicted HNH restriction endonuclease